jgi:hypothetical protein
MQISRACEALGLEGIVHRDIAARNVFLTAFDPELPQDTCAKLSVFGMSVCEAVPVRWMAPESLQHRR